MSDPRATERLLEVIEEKLPAAGRSDDTLGELLIAVQELRRRGDTLVRRDDLRRCVEALALLDWDMGAVEKVALLDSRDRLEIALGGKIR